ncbi:hypothetical protein C4D60_Mb10t21810 [Musa balbisiana]|uniref:Uncharacterized protein n=1 Tax=Musa balbisiana TaxID=52838 RepID=A0A4S8J0A4_MUSBA|nr:hypothetical protein C4D60_Mb10t21810 [Musa balbisiana]
METASLMRSRRQEWSYGRRDELCECPHLYTHDLGKGRRSHGYRIIRLRRNKGGQGEDMGSGFGAIGPTETSELKYRVTGGA